MQQLNGYFDNSATTEVCPAARRQVICALDDVWANPSSLHEPGIRAQSLLTKARRFAASTLCCDEGEIYFTCGGTQANNIAVLSAANSRRKGRVITSAVEHPSVSECFDRLEQAGFEVVRLPVDKFGRISLESLSQSVDDGTVLVSLMAVNNELGTVEPVAEAGKIIKAAAPKALFHVDAVQAYGKMPLRPHSIGCDLLTISSHKVHGPKGAGALFVKKGVRLRSPTAGGGQEGGIRSGTEPTPAIFGFYGAMTQIDVAKNREAVGKISRLLKDGLSQIDGAVINSPPDALEYIINISFPGIPGEVMLNYLSEAGYCVSTGSACARGKKSHVLSACGLDSRLIASSIRISLSRFNTEAQAEGLLNAICAANSRLKRK